MLQIHGTQPPTVPFSNSRAVSVESESDARGARARRARRSPPRAGRWSPGPPRPDGRPRGGDRPRSLRRRRARAVSRLPRPPLFWTRPSARASTASSRSGTRSGASGVRDPRGLHPGADLRPRPPRALPPGPRRASSLYRRALAAGVGEVLARTSPPSPSGAGCPARRRPRSSRRSNPPSRVRRRPPASTRPRAGDGLRRWPPGASPPSTPPRATPARPRQAALSRSRRRCASPARPSRPRVGVHGPRRPRRGRVVPVEGAGGGWRWLGADAPKKGHGVSSRRGAGPRSGSFGRRRRRRRARFRGRRRRTPRAPEEDGGEGEAPRVPGVSRGAPSAWSFRPRRRRSSSGARFACSRPAARFGATLLPASATRLTATRPTRREPTALRPRGFEAAMEIEPSIGPRSGLVGGRGSDGAPTRSGVPLMGRGDFFRRFSRRRGSRGPARPATAERGSRRGSEAADEPARARPARRQVRPVRPGACAPERSRPARAASASFRVPSGRVGRARAGVPGAAAAGARVTRDARSRANRTVPYASGSGACPPRPGRGVARAPEARDDERGEAGGGQLLRALPAE